MFLFCVHRVLPKFAASSLILVVCDLCASDVSSTDVTSSTRLGGGGGGLKRKNTQSTRKDTDFSSDLILHASNIGRA